MPLMLVMPLDIYNQKNGGINSLLKEYFTSYGKWCICLWQVDLFVIDYLKEATLSPIPF